MKRISTIHLTPVPFRELIATQAKGWLCDCRRKTDDNECGQSRLTFSFIFSEFRFGFSLSPRGPLGRSPALNKQDLKSEKNIALFTRLVSPGCHAVLCVGAGRCEA